MASVSLKAGINFAFLIHNYDPNHKGKQGYCLQGSGGCFDGGQLVVTHRGSIPISEVVIGDRVLSFNGDVDEWKTVSATHQHNNTKKCYRVVLKNGREIIATHDHEFYHEGTWIELKHLLSLLNDKKINDNRGQVGY